MTWTSWLQRIGGIGGRAAFERDGTLTFHDAATVWDDRDGQLFASRLESPASDITFNFTDLTVDFDADSEYPTDFVSVVYQMRHRYKHGSEFGIHLHWIQSQNACPNWLIAYRIIENGKAPTAWALAPCGTPMFPYVAGGMNIVDFVDVAGVNGLSFAVQVKLYRDTTNASELFGADAYTGDAQAVFMDLHYEADTMGSRQEYVK